MSEPRGALFFWKDEPHVTGATSSSATNISNWLACGARRSRRNFADEKTSRARSKGIYSMNEAQTAVNNAISFEVKKDGLQQRQSGDWKLGFTVASVDMDQRLSAAPMGTRYACVLVEVNDDETPTDHKAQDRDKWRALGPMRQAGIRCKEVLFWTFPDRGTSFREHQQQRERGRGASRARARWRRSHRCIVIWKSSATTGNGCCGTGSITVIRHGRCGSMPDLNFRQPRQLDPEYLDFIRSLPCCLCGDNVSAAEACRTCASVRSTMTSATPAWRKNLPTNGRCRSAVGITKNSTP